MHATDMSPSSGICHRKVGDMSVFGHFLISCFAFLKTSRRNALGARWSSLPIWNPAVVQQLCALNDALNRNCLC